MGFILQVVRCHFCKQLAGAADDSTHMHTARYATDNNTEVMCLCTDLQLTRNFCPDVELNALSWNGVSTK